MDAMMSVPNQRIRVAVFVGTRQEAVKMAPVVRALRRRPRVFEVKVIATAKDRQLFDQVIDKFALTVDIDLDVVRDNQSLPSLWASALERIDRVLDEEFPDLVLVQGDTMTAFAASFAAFLHHIPVGHIEAGLRSGDLQNPFPEEANRRLTSIVSDIHFAPTSLARYNLIREGISYNRIAVTGSPVVDALQRLTAQANDFASLPPDMPQTSHRIVLVASLRRESWGEDIENSCTALWDLVQRFPDIAVVYPLHPSAFVRKMVLRQLSGHARIHLIEPMDYLAFLRLLQAAHLVLTDSSSVQEEAPCFGKPVLVLRRTTERPEAAFAGLAKIIGTSPATIVEEAGRLLADEEAHAAMVSGPNPFGDGRAAERIVDAIERWKKNASPLLLPGAEYQPDSPFLLQQRNRQSVGELTPAGRRGPTGAPPL